jgi:hypothetical protein
MLRIVVQDTDVSKEMLPLFFTLKMEAAYGSKMWVYVWYPSK